jgi:hypothetical protein
MASSVFADLRSPVLWVASIDVVPRMEYRDVRLNRISEAVAVTPSTDGLRPVVNPHIRVSDRRMDNSQLPVNLGMAIACWRQSYP